MVADLLGWPPGVPPALLHTRLAQRLARRPGLCPRRRALGGGDLGGRPGRPAGRGRSVGCVVRAVRAKAVAGRCLGVVAVGSRSREGTPGGRWRWRRWPRRTSRRPTWPSRGCLPHGRRYGLVRRPAGPHFATIGEAIRASEPGARIVVAAGHYAEALILDRPVEVIAAGTATPFPRAWPPVGRVPTAGAAATPGVSSSRRPGRSCIRMETGYAVVRGLFLRGRTGLDDRTRFAVDVPQGQLILEDCDITSDALACVAIHGSERRPVLRRCQIHDGKGSGVFVHHGGAGTLEDCAIVNNALAGVEIGKDGNPTVRRCTVMDGRGPGVYVSLGGCGTFEACVVSGNGGAGIEIGWLGSPVLRRCRVTRNRHSAVRLYAGGGCTFEACDFSGNDGGAWDIAGGWLQHNGARDGADGHTYIRSGSDDEPEPEHLDADADGNEHGHGSGDGTAGAPLAAPPMAHGAARAR